MTAIELAEPTREDASRRGKSGVGFEIEWRDLPPVHLLALSRHADAPAAISALCALAGGAVAANAVEPAGARTPLALAVLRGEPSRDGSSLEPVVRALIEARADADAKLAGRGGGTALVAAARLGFAGVVSALAAAGADVEATASGGFTALALAVWKNRAPCVRALLAAGARASNARVTAFDLERDPMILALRDDRHEILGLLAAAAPDAARAPIAGMANITLLHRAAIFGQDKCARALIGALGECALSARDGDGNAPLHVACAQCRTAVAVTLVELGASTDAVDARGSTPLATVAGARPCFGLPIIEALLAARADVEAGRDAEGRAPLAIAAAADRDASVAALLRGGAAVDSAGPRGMTALMWAAAAGHESATVTLLANGASRTAANDSGMNAAALAAANGRTALARVLAVFS